ncbi:MAG TPA: GNAT family N-acetyltransferase [Burkholderiales bacterium]|nr:GNAT family N-acetyltransferase [Burkholderiales bacterium]
MKAVVRNLVFRPLTPGLMDCMGRVLRGSWGAGCWCMYPRLARAEMADTRGARRREAMTKLARRRRSPGLLAFEGDEPVGWVAVAPRAELARLDASRATPRVDDVDVWVIPCVTVRPGARGRGIALALIRAAVAYAARWRAPAVEAYPRAGGARTADDNAYIGTEPLFRRAGFRVIRKPRGKPGRSSLRRVAMRVKC